MGQSITLFFLARTELSSFLPTVNAIVNAPAEEVAAYEGQIEIVEWDRYPLLIIRPCSDDRTQFAWDDWEDNPYVNEQFRREVRGTCIFSVDFHSLELTRNLATAVARDVVARDERMWMDTDFGWVIEARELLDEIERDPAWDWRVDKFVEEDGEDNTH